MVGRMLSTLVLILAAAMVGAAQAPEEYLDVLITKVKPERRAEFDAINKKMADANRRVKGDTWLAMETTYGENNTVTFISQRRGYGEMESDTFAAALNKAFGKAGAEKLMRDFNSTLVSSRSEV